MNIYRFAIGAVALMVACDRIFGKKEGPKAEKTPALEPANCMDIVKFPKATLPGRESPSNRPR